MILALEGPDKAGKTTLWNALRPALPYAVFVPRLPLPPALFPVMAEVELRDAALWEALYDPGALYVCDRHLAVSGRVYDAFYGRKTLVDWRVWVPRLLVAYVDVDEAELMRRCTDDEYCRPEHYGRLLSIYSQVLQDYDSVRVKGVEDVVRAVEQRLEAEGAAPGRAPR